LRRWHCGRSGFEKRQPFGGFDRVAIGCLHVNDKAEALITRSELGGALGEMLPLNVATIAPNALESPYDKGNSSGRRKFLTL